MKCTAYILYTGSVLYNSWITSSHSLLLTEWKAYIVEADPVTTVYWYNHLKCSNDTEINLTLINDILKMRLSLVLTYNYYSSHESLWNNCSDGDVTYRQRDINPVFPRREALAVNQFKACLLECPDNAIRQLQYCCFTTWRVWIPFRPFVILHLPIFPLGLPGQNTLHPSGMSEIGDRWPVERTNFLWLSFRVL